MARFDGKNTKQRATTLKITEWSGVTRGAHDGARVTIAKAADPYQVLVKATFDEIVSSQEKEREARKVLEPEMDKLYNAQDALWQANRDAFEAGDVEGVKRNLREFAEHLLKESGVMAKKLTTDELVGQALDNEKRDMIEDILENPAYGKTIEERIAHAKKLLNTQKAAGSMTFEEWLKENPGKTEEDFKAEFKKFRALAEMNDLQKSHFNSLTTDVEKSAFIAMSSDERNTTVEMIKSMDETFTNDAGVTIAKSAVGSELFTMLKTQNDEIVKMRNEQVMLKYTGEANSDSRMHLPGDEIAKAKALQYIDAAPEEIRKTIGEMLNAGNGAMKESLTVKASAGGENHTPTVALQKMNAMVQKHMTDHNVTKFAAMEALAKNAEYCALEEEARGEA